MIQKLVNPKPSSRQEEKLLLDVALKKCKTLSQKYIDEWVPINKSWSTVEGCVYIRLSTEQQCLVDDGSLIQQAHIMVEEMRRLSKLDQINYRITHFYIDAGISGQIEDRPQFLLMRKNIKKKKHGFAGFKELARASRNALLVIEITTECHAAGCRLVIPNFPINLNDPTSVFQLNLMAAVGQYEASNTSKRVRENVYSAMINGGKFNATHPVLGLDPIEGKVGLYKANIEELKTVSWVMNTFIRLGSYQATLEEIEKHGVKNKYGTNFKKNSLTGLLTNIKYIGKWELNKKNKGKDNHQLMSFEQHKEVDLPHGCVVDSKLFEKVQATVRDLKGNKAKVTRIKRVYPLSGILKLKKDGSNFGGSSANGKTQRSDYYQNTKHHIRLSAEVLELEAKKVMLDIIKNSTRLQTALVERAKSAKTAAEELQGQAELIRGKITQLQNGRNSWDKRLDFLIAGASSEEANMFKAEYVEAIGKIKSDIDSCNQQISTIERSRSELHDADLTAASLVARSEKILKLIQERDPVALKNAYRTLFTSIEVSDLDANGKRILQFNISSSDEHTSVGNRRTDSGIENKMAQMAGLEPATKRLTVACSTN